MEPAFDEALEATVARAAAGDMRGMNALFERFHDGVHRYAYIRIGNAADAEEAAAEVFAQMVRSIHSYRERGPGFAAWLYRIARNVVADHHRDHARHREDLVAALPERATPALEDTVDVRERVRMLRTALETLPDEQQQVLLLRFAGGLSAEEIGAVIGKSAGAVRIQQMRALQRLRERIEVEAS